MKRNTIKLSVVVSSYNGGDKIGKCLESVKKIADEIIIVNNSSTDNTVKTAQKYTKAIFTRPNNPMLNVNKNYGFSKANGEWILNLDDDERVTPELAKEIEEKMNNKNFDGYWIPRKNIIFGKWIENSIWWPDYQLRFFRNGKGKFPEKHVHEYVEVKGETEKMSSPILHENYKTISQFLRKMDSIYTESEVENILNDRREINFLDAIRFPLNDFLKTFFLQKGYRDGLHGLVLSILQAFYSFVVFAKVWEHQGFKEYNNSSFLNDVQKEMNRAAHETSYWFLNEKIEREKNPSKKVMYKILQKTAKQKSRI